MLSSEPHDPSQDSTCWQLCNPHSDLQQVSQGLREDTHCIKGASSLSSLLISFCSVWWQLSEKGVYMRKTMNDIYEAATQCEEIETQQTETRRRGSWCTPWRDIPLILFAAESVPRQLQLIQCQTPTHTERSAGRRTQLWETRRIHEGQRWHNYPQSSSAD